MTVTARDALSFTDSMKVSVHIDDNAARALRLLRLSLLERGLLLDAFSFDDRVN